MIDIEEEFAKILQREIDKELIDQLVDIAQTSVNTDRAIQMAIDKKNNGV